MPTPRTPELDKQAYDIWLEMGKSRKKTAQKIGIPESTLDHRIERHQKRIACDAAAPDGYQVKGTSTLFNSKGEVVAQWIKTTRDQERLQELLQQAILSLSKEVVPVEPVPVPSDYNNDLCALYTLTDYHIGMFAHAEESGADWDLQISASYLKKWAVTAVEMSPPAHTAVFYQGGDFLHFDSLLPVTPKSRHVVDACGRFQKLIDVAITGVRYAVEQMLSKHQHVHLIMGEGNHDESSSAWLRAMFAALYENEPRVTVDRTEHPYYAFEWGNTSIFAHHGDKRNIGNISSVVASLYREIYGRTKFSYCHMGHVHHSVSKEDNLMQVIVHPTLAARDSYAARYGFLSQRKARTFYYHKEYGEVGSTAITPEMLK